MTKKFENYNVQVLTYNNTTYQFLEHMDGSEVFHSYEEARSEASYVINHLTPGEQKKASVWIIGWNGDEYPEEGADYEEEII